MMDDCWEFDGWLDDGTHAGRQYRAVYALYHGQIRRGYQIHHICHNGACYNPRHLEQLTVAAHKRRHRARPTVGVSAGRRTKGEWW